MPVRFFSEDIPFKISHPRALSRWVRSVVQAEHHYLNEVNFIFCSDVYLLTINRTYLEHDYFTDIITFNNADKEGKIEGDIFISVERVRENACILNVSFLHEIHRVMVHGVLHLIGYNDITDSDRLVMRQKEDFYLSWYMP